MEQKKLSMREILTFAVFIGAVGVLFALNLILPKPDILVAERRAPARFPDLTLRSVMSADFMKKFENYAADNFVFRDTFRAVRTFTVLDVFMQSDKSGLYISSDVGRGEFKRTDETAFRQTAGKIRTVAESLRDMNVYYSIIPDKSVFSEKYMPGFDLGRAEDILSEELAGFSYIPLEGVLGAESYYKTDLHWDQTKIDGVARRVTSYTGAQSIGSDANAQESAGEFRGVYAGQLALPTAPDIMGYSPDAGLKAHYLNTQTLAFEEGPVYDAERFTGVDPYDFFLRGPQPLIVLENENAPQERELFLFRDSFGSSLAPLLAKYYSKITLIDLRYINAQLLDDFVAFTPGADVLFMYGSQIFNNSSVLQV
ncbi:MAG: hypothetical protein LBR85_05995 [Oscillospiraceae bacterium]|jgi:hypothetical protein|nr:hypothetical protein [Oscillospiraceae bacterium]